MLFSNYLRVDNWQGELCIPMTHLKTGLISMVSHALSSNWRLKVGGMVLIPWFFSATGRAGSISLTVKQSINYPETFFMGFCMLSS
jgi:hypothetical protein